MMMMNMMMFLVHVVLKNLKFNSMKKGLQNLQALSLYYYIFLGIYKYLHTVPLPA